MERLKDDRSFIFTALGAAMGLGNALRFPGLCAKYGGAFIIAYAAVLVFIGFPLLKCEFALGKRLRSPFPCAMRAFGRFPYAAGWAACVNSALIAIYYSAVIARLACSAADFSTGGNFYCLQDTSAPYKILTVAAWAVLFLLLTRGSLFRARLARAAVCFQTVMLIVLAARGLIFNNSFSALRALFVPRSQSFADPSMWLGALGQGLLSLSVAAGVMPAFAEAMPERLSDGRCAAIVIAANFCGCILSSVAMTTNAYGVTLASEISENGFKNAFTLYPAILGTAFKNAVSRGIFGALFFLSLALTAVVSAISLLSAPLSPLSRIIPRRRAALALCSSCACFSVLLALFPDGIYAADFVTCAVAAPLIALSESAVFIFNARFFFRGLTVRRAGGKINAGCKANKIGRWVKVWRR